MVVSNTAEQEVLLIHSIYRGFAPTLMDQELFLQSSLQLSYHHRFAYSLELFQCISSRSLSSPLLIYVITSERKGDETTYATGSGQLGPEPPWD